jgi:hypothetical protein
MSLLSIAAAAMIDNAEAGELPYDVTGGQAFEISATGHKVLENGVAYLALTDVADTKFRDELLYLMGEGNLVNKTVGSTVLFRLGCTDKGGIKNDDLAMSQADSNALWASTAMHPVQVVLSFKVDPIGTDGECVSLAEGLRVTHSSTGTTASR